MHKVARDPSPHSHHHPRRAPFPPNSSLSLSRLSPPILAASECYRITMFAGDCANTVWFLPMVYAHPLSPLLVPRARFSPRDNTVSTDINRGKRAAAPVSNSRAPFSSSRNHQVKGKKEASNSPLYSLVSLPPFPSGRRIDVRPKLETKVVTLTLHLRRFRLACSGVSRNRLAASRDRTCATSQGGN